VKKVILYMMVIALLLGVIPPAAFAVAEYDVVDDNIDEYVSKVTASGADWSAMQAITPFSGSGTHLQLPTGAPVH